MKHSQTRLQWAWSEVVSLLSKPRVLMLLAALLATQLGLALTGTDVMNRDTGCKLRDLFHDSWVEDFFYNKVMPYGLHIGQAQRVALITLTENVEPLKVLTNTCEDRIFIANVLREIDSLGAKVIAIDQSYSEGSCTTADPNRYFRSVLQNLKAPVVVGQRVHKRRQEVDDGDCLVADTEFDFMPADPSPLEFARNNVHVGLLRLNDNVLKIPLFWNVFKNDSSSDSAENTPDTIDGFAYVAATQAEPALANNWRIRKLRAEYEHPYASFVSGFPTWSAMDLLCNGPDNIAADHPEWGNCKEVAHTPFRLTGKVVVLGQHTDLDLKSFPGQDKFGMDLHANYIEALLQSHYLGTVPEYLDLGCVIGFFAVGVMLEALNMRNPSRIRQIEISFAMLSLYIVLLLIALYLLEYESLVMPHLIVGALAMLFAPVTYLTYAALEGLNGKYKTKGSN